MLYFKLVRFSIQFRLGFSSVENQTRSKILIPDFNFKLPHLVHYSSLILRGFEATCQCKHDYDNVLERLPKHRVSATRHAVPRLQHSLITLTSNLK